MREQAQQDAEYRNRTTPDSLAQATLHDYSANQNSFSTPPPTGSNARALRQNTILRMQQTHGNAYVSRFIHKTEALQRQAAEEPTAGGDAAGGNTATGSISVSGDSGQVGEKEAASDTVAAAEQPSTAASSGTSIPPHQTVKTILRPGSAPQTSRDESLSLGASGDVTAYSTVAPGGSPAVNNSAGGNDCTPSTNSAVLNWDVVAVDPATWGVNVTSLALAGQINIKPWPSNPTSMSVPNTANPVDGGNINNTAGSSNHFQAAIDDMADYDTAGGGAGPNWHSTAASSAHEWAHWNVNYVPDAVSGASGGNWPQANRDLDALREPVSSSATAAAARTVLEPKVSARMRTWRSATIARWNSIIGTTDTPGAGGAGYAAGAGVLGGLIGRVNAYKTTKGW